VSECLSALALPPLRNISLPKTMVPVVKTSVHFCSCHNTSVQIPHSVPGGLLLLCLAGLLATSLHFVVLLRCGRVTCNDESKGGRGSTIFLVNATKSYRGSRSRAHLYLAPTLRKRGSIPPIPYMPSWRAQMKILLLYQTTRSQKQFCF
jgi:hypothetical protein